MMQGIRGLLLLSILGFLSAKVVKMKPKLSYKDPWKYMTKMIITKSGNYQVEIENNAKSLPTNFSPEMSPMPRLEVLIYNEQNYFKALEMDDCLMRRNKAMGVREEKIARILPKKEGEPAQTVYSPVLRIGPYKTQTTIYFVACACYTADKQRQAREQYQFNLNKATYKQLLGGVNIKLTVKNHPNTHMSVELYNVDNKYIYFFIVEIAMLVWLVFKFKKFYRMHRTCDTPLTFLLVGCALDIMSGWALWMHFDWYTGNGQGLNFLYVIGYMCEQLSHFLHMTVFGTIALGWMITESGFPDNEGQLVAAIGMILIAVVIAGLNIITVDTDSNFQTYGLVQTIFLTVFSIVYIVQHVIEFASLKSRALPKVQISVNQFSVVAVFYASLFPFLSILVRTIVPTSNGQSVFITLYLLSHLGAQAFLIAKLGSQSFWKEAHLEEGVPLPNKKFKMDEFYD